MEEPPVFGDRLQGGRGQESRESIEISRATAGGEGAGLIGEAMWAALGVNLLVMVHGQGSSLKVVIEHHHRELNPRTLHEISEGEREQKRHSCKERDQKGPEPSAGKGL